MTTLELSRLSIHCTACGARFHTFVSQEIADDEDLLRMHTNRLCDEHTVICPVRNEPHE